MVLKGCLATSPGYLLHELALISYFLDSLLSYSTLLLLDITCFEMSWCLRICKKINYEYL